MNNLINMPFKPLIKFDKMQIFRSYVNISIAEYFVYENFFCLCI